MGMCNCKRFNNDYCEEILKLSKLTKNNVLVDLEKAKRTYQVRKYLIL